MDYICTQKTFDFAKAVSLPYGHQSGVSLYGGNGLIGAHSPRATPVPIPNTAVKPRSGDNTWGPPLGK